MILNKRLPDSSGVYFLWSKYELLYIGKSNNIRKRVAQHLSRNFFSKDMVVAEEVIKVSFLLTRDEFDALRLESHLLKIFPTKWNGNPAYNQEWFQDMKFGRGMFEFVDFNGVSVENKGIVDKKANPKDALKSYEELF
jgi:predicted GIY-YIG superfamily endonuclease